MKISFEIVFVKVSGKYELSRGIFSSNFGGASSYLKYVFKLKTRGFKVANAKVKINPRVPILRHMYDDVLSVRRLFDFFICTVLWKIKGGGIRIYLDESASSAFMT